MKLSLNERRRRLRELMETHSGLVLASALLKGGDAENVQPEWPFASLMNQNGGMQTDPQKRAALEPATASRRPRNGSDARAWSKGGAQLRLW
jgi:hypothetical protein